MIENIKEYKYGDEFYYVDIEQWGGKVYGIYRCKFVGISCHRNNTHLEQSVLFENLDKPSMFLSITDKFHHLHETRELAIDFAKKFLAGRIEFHKCRIDELTKDLKLLEETNEK